ncbi:urease accessory protein UreD [Gluconobacter cerinus]|uniref:urease accessory protein UreD n=1 Tax=Gluconobacter cerinus TaxID=38307 RepID=UPI001B8D630E|nr:urease accessory protein UreD [Gluconobacter cerinus]MBS1019131.1 urease accessory protein UreD [Gluconobacter cerinus]MCW2264091.1 urease accessory protein [Gluconobacter cerinus]
MTAAVLQRARGWFSLTAKLRDGATVCGDLEQGGCCRLLFPRVDKGALEAVTVNISGGIAGGDRIEGRIICGPDTELLVTSQAAERVYRARTADKPSEILTSCHIATQARLDWIPHGTIFFDGSQLRRHMTVEMEASSTFLFLESRMFGRIGSGEVMQVLNLRDRLTVRRDGRLVLEDLLRLEGSDVATLLAQKAIANDQFAVATLVLVSPAAEGLLVPVREKLEAVGPHEFAASAWNGMLIIRGVASSGWLLEKTIRQILPVLRDRRPMPATWRS